MLWDLSEVLQYQLLGLSHREGTCVPQISKLPFFCIPLSGPWQPMGCRVAPGRGQHEASAPRGPAWDVALLQGTAAAPSSAVSQAFADQNRPSSGNKQGTKILDNSCSSWVSLCSRWKHFAPELWEPGEMCLSSLGVDYFPHRKWPLATFTLFLGAEKPSSSALLGSPSTPK